jgi:hypothetical protein
LEGFIRDIAGSDSELHPDFGPVVILMGDEDPLPAIRAGALPRYSFRDLEVAADALEDELKQLENVGKVRKIGVIPEALYLLYSMRGVEGRALSSQRVMEFIATRNALIPGGTLSTEGQNFPVQLSGEFKQVSDLLGAVVGQTSDGTPTYLRDVFEVRRGYENPVEYEVSVRERSGGRGSVDREAGRDGGGGDEGRPDHPGFRPGCRCGGAVGRASGCRKACEIRKLSDQPAAVAGRVDQFPDALWRRC